MAKEIIYDAIIVGSGATGGWAAKELTQKGLKVVVLEAGRKLDPLKEYTEHTWPYELKYRGFGDQRDMMRTQPFCVIGHDAQPPGAALENQAVARA